MNVHKNAKLTPRGRAEIVRRVIDQGQTPKAVGTRQRRRLFPVRVMERRLQQRRVLAGAKRGPPGAGLNGRAVFVGNQRQTTRDRHVLPELPVLGRERVPILVEKQDLGRVTAQQARIERG